MMTLSSEAKKYHSRDYRDLCQKTREGIYVNVLYNDEGVAANAANRESEKIDKIANRFFSTMDVYPSKTKTITIREFFGTFWSLPATQTLHLELDIFEVYFNLRSKHT